MPFSNNFINDIGNKNSGGGSTVAIRRAVTEQGSIDVTSTETDLALSGKGMFVVQDRTSGTFSYSRDGFFRPDESGDLVNNAGFRLMAWSLDGEGRRPGEPGNIDTTANTLLSSLKAINLRNLQGESTATSTVDLEGVNLNAGQEILKGAADTISIPVSLTTNRNIRPDDIIIPDANMRQGDELAIQIPNNELAYVYGGISTSNDVTTNIFGSTAVESTFDVNNPNLSDNDNFYIFTPSVARENANFTFVSTRPVVEDGQFNSLETLRTAINLVDGLNAKINGGAPLYITYQC